MIKIKAFECEFCNKKIYRHKSSTIAHEKKCFANPANKACRTCTYAIKDSETVYTPPQGEQNYGDSDYDIDYIYCEITNKYLSHPDKLCKFEHHCNYYKEGNKLF